MPVLLILLLATIISAYVCFKVAHRKHLNTQFWVIIACFIGPLAIPAVFLAKSNIAEPNLK